MTAPTPAPSPVTEHLLRQLRDEEVTITNDAATATSALGGPHPGVTPTPPPPPPPPPAASQANVATNSGAPSADEPDPTAAPAAGLTELTGLETMARPWRLLLLGLGAAIGLVAWLVVANGQSTLGSPLVSVAAFVAALAVGIGLLAVANERDRLGPHVNILAIAVGVTYALVVWLNPTPLEGIDRWLWSQRMLVTLVGFAAGLVLAGVICLATLRRSPTLTVALSIIAGVLVLAAVTVLRQNEWGGVAMFSLAFFLVLGAWDRSPRREVAFEHPPDTPRAARAALCLSILALGGSAIDYVRHSDNRSSGWLPAVLIVVLLTLFAVAVLFRLRSDLENRDTRTSDWTSWMREIRTNEFRRGFESMATAAPDHIDAPFADLGEPLRAETDVARATDELTRATYADLSPADLLPQDHPAASGDRAAGLASPPHAPSLAGEDGIDAAPFDFATAGGAELATGVPQAAAREVPAITIPLADDDAAEPADQQPIELYHAPRPTGNGAFSVFAQPEPIAHEVPDAEAFATWLATNPSERPALFIAIECMFLSTFSALSPAYQTRVVAKVAEALRDLSPRPDPIAWIDGPYFLAAIAAFERHHVSALNRQLQELLTTELVFDDVVIPLRGTLALLTPRETVAFDQLLDDAVNGLIQARHLEA